MMIDWTSVQSIITSDASDRKNKSAPMDEDVSIANESEACQVEQAATLVDLGFNVTATRIPTLEEAARTLDLVIEGMERGIKDRIRFGYPVAEYETDVFAHAGLIRVQKLVRCTMFCEAEVTETIKVALSKLKAQERLELQAAAQIEKDRKERARQWVQRRKDDKKIAEEARQEAAE